MHEILVYLKDANKISPETYQGLGKFNYDFTSASTWDLLRIRDNLKIMFARDSAFDSNVSNLWHNVCGEIANRFGFTNDFKISN